MRINQQRVNRNRFYFNVSKKGQFEHSLWESYIKNFTFSDWRQIVTLAHEGNAAIEDEENYIIHYTDLNQRVLKYLRISGFNVRRYGNGWEISIN